MSSSSRKERTPEEAFYAVNSAFAVTVKNPLYRHVSSPQEMHPKSI